MRNFIRFFIITFLFAYQIEAQTVRAVVPDSGYQGTSFSVNIYGSGTQWHYSPYFEVYFDSVAHVTTENVVGVNDTLITATVNVTGTAELGWKWIIVSDAFINVFYKDTALNILLSIPVIPKLVSPLNNSLDLPPTPTFLWDSNTYATSFRIQISTDSIFSTLNIKYDTIVANTPLSLRPNVLTLGEKYFWRVNASNSIGTSNWSSVWNFRVVATEVKLISSGIPNEYKLYNNYPNPFNPSTKIKYSIPGNRSGNEFVTLKIFDMLGKEIVTLVNENQKPGNYEITFNTSQFGLSSGVYFYRLTTEDFAQVKKMTIVK
jgi:hypothetical protein